MRDFIYPVTRIHTLTDSVSQIFLQTAPQPSLSYEAGQYVEIIHQNQAISPLSIACAPNPQGIFEFHLFHSPDNAKAVDLLRTAKQEKAWHVRGPLGSCTVKHLQADKPILFLARGTGFAPVKAVIEALMQSPTPPSMHFYWSVQKPADIYLQTLLQQWQHPPQRFTFTPVYTAETTSDWPVKVMLKDHADFSQYQVYASGPRPLMQGAFTAFEERGLQRAHFHSDVF